MTSTVTDYSALIDTAFPVPGADNDTQGFRNNFGNIQSALTNAATEISELQVIQSALVSLTSTEPASSVGAPGDINGQIYVNSSTIAIAYNNYVGITTPIWNIIDTTKIDNSVQYVNSAPAASTGTTGDLKGMIHATTNTLYICFNDYVGTATSIWGKLSLDSVSW